MYIIIIFMIVSYVSWTCLLLRTYESKNTKVLSKVRNNYYDKLLDTLLLLTSKQQLTFTVHVYVYLRS